MNRRLLVAMLLGAAMSGCASPGADDRQADDTAGIDPSTMGAMAEPRHKQGDFNLTGTGFTTCTPVVQPESMGEVNWVAIHVEREDSDTSIAVRYDWVAANPTLEAIRFRVMDGPLMFNGAKTLDEWDGVSYQVRTFDAEELATLPDPFYVQASLTGCPPEGVVGIHVAPAGQQEQPVHFQIAWNGAPFA